MGSPLGPPLANVFMPSLEEKLESVGNLPVSYRRYVDDTLTVIRPNYSYGLLKHPQPGPLFLLSVFLMETEKASLPRERASQSSAPD